MSSSEIAKEIFKCVELLNEKLEKKDWLKSFRRRARDMPELIFTRGLGYTLAYIASKSSATYFEHAFMFSSCEDLVSRASQLRVGEEEAGYTLYAWLLTLVLKDTGLVKASRFSELLASALENPLLESTAFSIAEWIKRAAEAYIEERR